MPISIAIGKQQPVGGMLAVAHANTPYFDIYDIDSGTDTFTKRTPPVNLPSNDGFGIDFSSDNTYLAFAGGLVPKVYKGSPYVKLTDPASMNGGGSSVKFSNNDDYLVYTVPASPAVYIYKRAGDTFTKLDNPASLPTLGYDSSFSPDDIYLAVADAVTPFIHIYKRAGDVFTKLSNPSTLPPSSVACCEFSPDGTYLAVGGSNSSPRLNIYKRSGDTFTKLANPAGMPTSNVGSITWSSDGIYLAMITASSPYFLVFKRDGDNFTLLSTPVGIAALSCDFSADDTYLAMGQAASPYISIYKRSGDIFTELTDPLSAAPSGRCDGVVFSNI